MIDQVFGELEHDGYAYLGKTIINVFGNECVNEVGYKDIAY